MAGGWTRDGAIQDQIDDTVSDAVKAARKRMPQGESAKECVECGDEIPKARRKALPGVKTCVLCQQSEMGKKSPSELTDAGVRIVSCGNNL